MHRIVSVVILCFWGMGAYAQSVPSNCPIDISPLGPGMSVQVKDLQFRAHPEYTEATLRLRNLDKRPINSIFMIVEFSRGTKFLESAVFYAATLSDSANPISGIKFSGQFIGAERLLQSLLPNESRTLEANVPITTVECPDEARVAFVRVDFSKGDPYNYRASAWKNQAWLDQSAAPPLPDLSLRTETAIMSLSIDEVGKPHVTSIHGDESEQISHLSHLIEKMWTFIPATYDGTAIASTVRVLVRVLPSENNPIAAIPADERRGTLTVLDIRQNERLGYEIFYGGQPVAAFGPIKPLPHR
jgi:hypothetical protein